MNAIVQTLNTAGQAFLGLAVPILIQSSLLILILLAVDAVLRKRVRAVFRYWIWMLVLVKLVLPPSLWSPVSVGTWLGDTLEVPTAALLEAPEAPPIEEQGPGSPNAIRSRLGTHDALATKLSSGVASFLSPPQAVTVAPAPQEPGGPAAPGWGQVTPEGGGTTRLVTHPPTVSLNWQGFALLVWAGAVTALLLLLAQRTFFVRGLVAQAEEASRALLNELDRCRQHLGLRQPIAARLSPNAASPAVCGLWRPVILIPQNLAARLHGTELQAVLFHELAHIKRGDLWINLLQTLLQILYFYNPLLWLANVVIRCIREQAVDETVLVAMGEAAPQYPDTLINVAKLALARRPALSLRLIGVVESQNALTSRIKHILNRPLPKTAKLGLLGLLAIIVIAVVLLPMAKGNGFGWPGSDVLIRFTPEDDGLPRTIGDMRVYARSYTVSFKRGETLAIIAELYQTGQPMRVLGCRTFTDPGRPERLSTTLTMRDLTKDRTAIEHSLEITLGKESLRATGVRVNTPEFFNNWDSGFLPVSEIAKKRRDDKPYVEFTNLLTFRVCPGGARPGVPWLWMPGYHFAWGVNDAYFILVRMLPLSQLDILQVDTPWEGSQLPDGTYLPENASVAQRRAAVDEYSLNLKRLVMRERMPLKKLLAHQYYRSGDPIWLEMQTKPGSAWKPNWDEIDRDPDDSPGMFLIDGKEYGCRQGFGPFDGGGGALEVFDNLYFRPGTFRLPVGKHTVAYAWKNVDVVDPNDPNHPVHFARLATDPAEFEVVAQLPTDYYRPVYQEGWEDILRRSIETHYTDEMHKYGVAGTLLALRINRLPFDTAFAVYVQAQGNDEQHLVGEAALAAGSYPWIMGCDHGVKELNWDTVGDKRWRIILRPSVDVAKKHPPIHEFYARDLVTDWLSFERSPEFTRNRLSSAPLPDVGPRYAGTIKADRPVDLDRLGRRWGGQGEAWPLPAGFDLGWSPANGGTLRIDPNSGVRLLWLPEANARLARVADQSRQRLVELPQSRTTEIVPPDGEWTLTAVRSSAGKVYFVTVAKVNETWANLRWEQAQEPTGYGTPAAAQDSNGPTRLNSPKGPVASLPNGVTVELLGACDYPSEGKQWWRPDGSPLAEAPYDRRGALVWPDDPNKFPFELAIRVRNLPEDWDARIDSPDNSFSNAEDPPYTAGRRLPELRWLMMEAEPNQTTCRIRCDLAAPWQVLARSSSESTASPQTPASGIVMSEIHEGFGSGRVFVSGRDSSGEGVSVTVTGHVGRYHDEWLFGVEGLHRVVALLKDGTTQTAPSNGLFFAEAAGKATAYFWRLSLADVQEFQFQTRAVTQVEFRNVPLRRGLKTDVAVDVRSADTDTNAASLPGAEREIVLPEADRQKVVLDLATGQLVPLPPVGPEPEKLEQALRTLGKGDLLYDCDQGDRTLILVRGATSEQAQRDTGEPPWKGYLIGPYLPGIITVKTAEGRQYKVRILAADDKACTLRYSLISTDKGAGGGALAEPKRASKQQNQKELRQLLADAQPGSVVTVPKDRYTTPVEVTTPVTLRGESAEGCIIEVTADQPALRVNTQGKGQVILENLTIRWQLAGDKKTELPAALWVKGTNVVIRNCRFAPLGDFQRSPMAVYIDRPSKSAVENCRFSGFDYVVCYGQGTEGVVQDCFITDCGHQGVIGYDGSTLTVQRNIITGSKFHAVRCTGGVLHVKDNLLIKNTNRGIYLGNKTGQGTITNNLILGNGSGISGFGRANYVIANNVIADNNFSGIDMRDSCRFSIRNNVLVKNQRGLALFKEGTENFNVIGKNAFWANPTDMESLEKPTGSLTADPQFADPNHGDFTVRGPVQEQGHGLSKPQILNDLSQRYEQLRTPDAGVGSPQASAPGATPLALEELSGRVVDANGDPVAGAQVAVSTEKIEVLMQNGRLETPRTSDTEKGQIVETDAQGRFRFEGQPPARFDLIAAQAAGFAMVTSDEFRKNRELQLEKWGRVEGQLAPGRSANDNQIWMASLPNSTWLRHRHQFRYETRCNAQGKFTFEQVPAGWFEVGYLIGTGDAVSTHTSRTPVVVQAGTTVTVRLGGEGRPVIGRFVPPEGYQGPVYFGAGLRALQTARPERPRPANYDQMTKRQQQEWLKQWFQTPEAGAYSDRFWHNPSWRAYAFRIQSDGSFRIEDVIPGQYRMTVYLEEQFPEAGGPGDFGGYSGTVEVPPQTEAYTDEPLDLGALTLRLRRLLHIGDMAPLFEAKTLDGQNLRLSDYRGNFVLLSFWEPFFHPEVDRLKELHKTYGGPGRLQVIGLGGWDTLEEVRKYVAEHQIEWPEVYLGENPDSDLVKLYGNPVASYIVLVDPQGKIIATWLRGERLTNTVVETLKNAPAAPSTANDASRAGLAWQRTDRYVPPDPNSFFPDDPEAGKRLDALYQAVDRDRRSDEEILATVRQGFRRVARYRADILGWIGNRYIWNQDPQNPQAVEIMYQAVPLEQPSAVYYGLSVLRHKPPNVLRTMTDICLRSRSDEVGRITWGLGPQREELLPYLTPYLQDPNAVRRELAGVLVKNFKGELDFDQWRRAKLKEQLKTQFAGRLPQFNQTLLTGDSQARYQALMELQRAGGLMVLDDSTLPALLAAGADPDRRVRNEVAQLVGNRWVWAAQKQDPNAIALMVRLGADSDRDVRNNAVYFGLSVVREKDEPVIRRLVELALSDHQESLYGRIVWGLRTFSRTAPDPFAGILAENLGRAKIERHHAASVYLLYRDILEKEPPEDWGLAQASRQYPQDVFVLPFSAREPFQPESADALWSEFARALPEGITAQRLPTWDTNKKDICYARIRGKGQTETVRKIISNHPRLRTGEVRPLPLATQLYLEEKYGASAAMPQKNQP